MKRIYLTPLLSDLYVDRAMRQKKEPIDKNIYENDMAANVFALVLLVGWIIYLFITEG